VPVIIDVGGTSTNISSICMGVPDLSEEGAIVGGWKTRVRAIRMETTATGGDSHIWAMNREFFLGPRWVVPLAVAAVQYPGFLNNLNRTPTLAREDLCENIQPIKFFVRSGYPAGELSKAEAEVLEVVGEEPTSVSEISALMRKDLHPQTFDSLIKKRLVQAIGFTPTDVLYVLGGIHGLERRSFPYRRRKAFQIHAYNSRGILHHHKKASCQEYGTSLALVYTGRSSGNLYCKDP